MHSPFADSPRPPLAPDGLPVGMPNQYGIPTLGWGVLAWGEEFLAQPDGVNAGEPWQWTQTQARIVAWWYAVDGGGRWLYRRGQIVLPKGSGKSPLAAALCCCELGGEVVFDGFDAQGEAVGRPHPSPHVQLAAVSESQPLALDVEVPTPGGWSTIGALRVGDYVFGSDGRPQRIERATDVLLGERCYRLVFDDGTDVVASAKHGWTLERLNGHGDEYEEAYFTTEQIASDYLLAAKRRKRYRLRTVGIEMPDADLSLDPWFLGLWLGDGSASDSTVAMDWRHRDEYQKLIEPLLHKDEIIVWRETPGTNVGTFRIRRRQYVCPRGHDYERSDFAITVDGHKVCRACIRLGKVGRQATPVIPTIRERLRAAGVLGDKHIPVDYLRASAAQRLALLQGLVDSDGCISEKGRVTFTNANARLFDQVVELVASLGYRYAISPAAGTARRVHFVPDMEPKVARLRDKASRQRPRPLRTKSGHRWIAEVREVPSVPVRCIGIDTPDHLFQVTRNHILTHNTDNTMSLVIPMLREGNAALEIPGLDIGLTRIRTRNGKLEPVTASASSREGQRLTACILDEPHLMTASNGGHRLAAVIRRNLGKLNGRSLETTNAWSPGEDSVAELTSIYADKVAEQIADGKRRVLEEGVLRYHPKASVPNLADLPVLRRALEGLYADAPWVDIDRIVSEVLDPGTHPSDARRFYLNAVTTADDALVTADEWDACYLDDVLDAGDEITLGFDGSKSDDASVLVAMRVSDRFATVIGAMEKPDHAGKDWEVDREFFDGLVANCFAQYRVLGFYSDVAHFESYVDRWSAEYGAGLLVSASPRSAVGWDMRGRLQLNTSGTERLVAGIQDGSVRHDGGGLLKRHVLNARRRPNRWGVSFGKERRDSPRKVDAFAALQLADMARADVVGATSKTRQRTGRVW